MEKPQIRILFEETEVQRRIRVLGQRLRRDLAVEDPVFVSIVGGSVLFLADLIRTMTEPVRYEFVQVQYSSGGDDEILDVHYPISMPVEGQEILVIKDVVSSGVIETYLRTQFQQLGAGKILFAALIDVPSGRKTDFEPDYRLFEAERHGIFVGYGLKYKGRYGNLSYIGEIVEGDEG